MNCAGLNRDFLETELFGHEKGAYTGAVASKQGLLEVAHRGVMFLDEIGDLDPQVQPKLLKVLEEKRFRRLGEVRDRQVDVQLVAASHQNLPQLVQEKKFRGDLYFRISTIPLRMPVAARAARGHPDPRAPDLRRASRATSAGGASSSPPRPSGPSAATRGPATCGSCATSWSAPCSCAATTSSSPATSASRAPGRRRCPSRRAGAEMHLTLEELEKVHIERVLREMGGRVAEASQRLGIPRSTLYQKIKKFSISLPRTLVRFVPSLEGVCRLEAALGGPAVPAPASHVDDVGFAPRGGPGEYAAAWHGSC